MQRHGLPTVSYNVAYSRHSLLPPFAHSSHAHHIHICMQQTYDGVMHDMVAMQREMEEEGMRSVEREVEIKVWQRARR